MLVQTLPATDNRLQEIQTAQENDPTCSHDPTCSQLKIHC